MKLRILPRILPLAAALLCGGLAMAQIERLTLPEMVAKSEGAVVGHIVSNQAFKVAGEDGPMFFTTLTIDGRSLVDGSTKTLSVTYVGGWISPDEGADCSEAPSAAETKVGNEVVVFHSRTLNMGNGVAGDTIHAWHGGIYPVARRAGRAVVQGRGEGYALDHNWDLGALDEEITRLNQGR